MAIKFSTKDQPARPAAAKPAKASTAPKGADQSAEAETDLFKSPAEPPKARAGKKK
jgi:hypothetical protein